MDANAHSCQLDAALALGFKLLHGSLGNPIAHSLGVTRTALQFQVGARCWQQRAAGADRERLGAGDAPGGAAQRGVRAGRGRQQHRGPRQHRVRAQPGCAQRAFPCSALPPVTAQQASSVIGAPPTNSVFIDREHLLAACYLPMMYFLHVGRQFSQVVSTSSHCKTCSDWMPPQGLHPLQLQQKMYVPHTRLCRWAGHNVEVEVVSAEPDADRGSEFAGSLLRLALPAGQAPGCLHVEVARGALLSGPKVRGVPRCGSPP